MTVEEISPEEISREEISSEDEAENLPKKEEIIVFFDQLFEKKSPEDIWNYISNSEHVGKWLMPGDIKPETGHKFIFDAKKAGSWEKNIDITVIESSPYEKLILEWVVKGRKSTVQFKIVPKDNNTKLLLTHRGNFTGIIGWIIGLYYKGFWPKAISRRLVQYVESDTEAKNPS